MRHLVRDGGACAALTVLLLIGATLAPVGVAAKSTKAPPDLSGVWRLDEENSETLFDALRNARRMGMPDGMDGPPGGGMGGGPPGGMGGGRHRGGPGGMPGGGPPDFGGEPDQDPEMAALAKPPMMLAIEQTSDLIVLRSRGETLKTLRLGPAGGGVVLEGDELAARWKGKRLEATGTGPRHGELTETYELDKSGEVLKITTRIKNAERLPSLSIKREYRRAAAP